MSDTARKVADDHLMTHTSGCTCGDLPLGGSFPEHVATVTEQAVRAQLAAQYTARAAHARTTAGQFVWQQAARTARGGEDQ